MPAKSLKTRLLVQISALLVGALLVGFLVAAISFSSALEDRVQERLAQEAEFALLGFEQRIAMLRQSTAKFSEHPHIINSVIDATGRDDYLPMVLESLAELDDVSTTVVVGFDGKVIHLAGTQESFAAASIDLNPALELGRSLLVPTADNHALAMVEPIEYYGTAQGAIVLIVDADSMSQRFFRDRADHHYEIRLSGTAVGEPASPTLQGSGSRIAASRTVELGQTRLAAQLTVSAARATVMAPARQSLLKLAIVTGCLLVVACLGTLIIGHRFVAPVRTLADRISSGSRCAPVGTDDELEILAEAFDRKTDDLISHQTSLEHSIRDRTAEIRSKNAKLETANLRLDAMVEELTEAKSFAESSSQAKSAFLANMSHEIRTPMNAVLGMTSLMLDDKLSHDQSERMAVIRSSTTHLLALINDILDFSKIQAGKLPISKVPCDIRAIIEDSALSLSGVAYARKVELVVEINPRVPSLVRCDPVRVRQVVANLLSNAIKFTKEGRVVVSLDASSTDANNYADVRLKVHDTGVGIQPEALGRIFDAFSQADDSIARTFGGTGLGLAIVKRLVEIMDGSIEAASECGTGSVFSVSLPLHVVVDQSSGQPAEVVGKRFVIVGSSGAYRRTLTQWLESWGGIVDFVPRKDTAQKLDSALRAEPGVAAIIVEEDAVTGLTEEELQVLRSTTSSIPRILFAPRSHDSDSAVAGFTLVRKPLRVNQLLSGIYDCVGNHEHAPTVIERERTTETAEAFPNLRVLLVDDVEVGRMVGAQLLESMGCVVDTAADGIAATRMIKRGGYALVFMDCQMPIQDGFLATQAVRQWEVDSQVADRTPIIALTAGITAEIRTQSQASGMDGFVTKPVSRVDLARAIAKALPTYRRPSAPSAGQLHDPANDTELERKFAAIFSESGKKHLVALGDAIVKRDASMVANRAHSFRGACGQLATDRLLELAQDIERRTETEDFETIGKLFDELEAVARAAFDLADDGPEQKAS